MPKKLIDVRPEIIYCACGCGQEVKRTRYPSQQRRFINGHQHKKENNGNYRGGKQCACCPVCGKTFSKWPSQHKVTCGDSCYREWQRLTTSARGLNKITVKCATCSREIKRFPSQVQERNYCNRYCLAADNPKVAHMNGNWKGGKWKYIKDQISMRDDHRCVICGFDYSIQIHHITPLHKGGDNSASNLITLCPNHHKMADLGIINVEHLRNTEWDYDMLIDPTPHANR